MKSKVEIDLSRDKISCNKLSELYYKEKGVNLSKTKVYYILKNKLNYHFLKTSVKNIKITYSNSLFMSLCFIKNIIRALILGYSILYMDESSLLSKNNNYKCWRRNNEQIYSKMKPTARSNLLLIISKNKVINYKINKVSTNEEVFLEFMIESINKIKEKK